jgi:succinate dehydrogenase hydrophobic anchor subunit
VALNPNGNDPVMLSIHRVVTLLLTLRTQVMPMVNGVRDIIKDWKMADTWKQMEAIHAKGLRVLLLVSRITQLIAHRKGAQHRRLELFRAQAE